jgi:hypothetical protein
MASTREKEKKAARRNSTRAWAEKQKSGFEATAVKLPEGVEYYEQERGVNKIDVIPYMVKRGQDKKGGNPNSDSGFLHFEREYEVHRVPGNGKFPDSFVCLKCFGETKCPGCEWMLENGKSADEKLVNLIRCQKRHLWIVNDKPGKAKNPLKVFNSNHFNRKLGFGQQFGVAAAAQLDEDEDFSDLENGKQVVFTVEGKFKHVVRVDFKERDYAYDKSILNHGIDLDACLIPNGEKMAEALSGPLAVKDDDEDDDEDAPHKPTKKRADDDEDDDDKPAAKKKAAVSDDDDDDDDRPAPKKKKPVDDDEDDDDDPEDSEIEDDDDDDDDPPAKKKPTKKKPADDDDDDDDDPPAKKKPTKKKPADDDDDDDDDDSELEESDDDDDDDDD